mmetsp:Transcript_69932/g.167867  ORF Transcript_69932/g.167867 Transcript_69932/m.167867 type:complete len:211 (-) Transcript_69932:1482-2114(-)
MHLRLCHLSKHRCTCFDVVISLEVCLGDDLSALGGSLSFARSLSGARTAAYCRRCFGVFCSSHWILLQEGVLEVWLSPAFFLLTFRRSCGSRRQRRRGGARCGHNYGVRCEIFPLLLSLRLSTIIILFIKEWVLDSGLCWVFPHLLLLLHCALLLGASFPLRLASAELREGLSCLHSLHGHRASHRELLHCILTVHHALDLRSCLCQLLC